ncbi:zona pellucida-like domain-containing protein 1 [Ascaphus truei]|uniref:zona pellucida-like domain-containing protein 1 n=1 Tax=Ascaphus truei TaxID=8439 RepID=UPI003F59B16D
MSFPLLLLLVISAQRCSGDVCSEAYSRLPDNSDIAVTCGPIAMKLSINACPVWFANFNPLDLALNGKHNQSTCLGTLDNSTNPPVMRFTLPVSDTSGNACGNTIQITEGQGSGAFSDYSSVQTVVISGFVDTLPPTNTGIVTYSTNLYYNFSCHYPLQYMLNNTQLLTSFGAVAINSDNGSFISTMSMSLFTDQGFSSALQRNGTVYPLKQIIYVQVTLNNSKSSFNVLLDQCFATPSAVVTTIPSEKYNFFTGCSVQNKTNIISNGKDKAAKFSFETFRFLQHSGQKTSTIYLHCITRLCEPEQCLQYLSGCTNTTRSKREANPVESATESVTVSSGPIYLTGGNST